MKKREADRPSKELNRTNKQMQEKHSAVEQMDFINAMRTFYALNGD